MRTIVLLPFICVAILLAACTNVENEIVKPLTEEEFEEIADNVESAVSTVQPIFNECNSIEEIEPYLDKILNTDGIEDAWTDAMTLFVKVKGYGTLYFLFPPDEKEIPLDDEFVAALKNTSLTRANNTERKKHITTEPKCARILFQQSKDLSPSRAFKTPLTKRVQNYFKAVGIEDTKVITEPSVELFRNGLVNCDVLFLMTHGMFDEKEKLHWLMTSDQLEVIDSDLNDNEINNFVRKYQAFVDSVHRAPKEIAVGYVKETRVINGRKKNVTVLYKMISEEFIEKRMARFANYGQVIVYSTACQSMKAANGGTSISLSEAFLRKGAACYLGWNESNGIGDSAGENFFHYLLSGRSAVSAHNMMDDRFTKDVFNGVPTKLEMNVSYNGGNYQYCLLHPTVLGLSIDNNTIGFPYVLYGYTKSEWPDTKLIYGFVISENKDMSNPIEKCEKKCDGSSWDCQFSEKDHSVIIRWTPDMNKLDPSKTYYYCAYLDDGDGICYSEPKELIYAPINERAILELHGPVKSVEHVNPWGSTINTFDKNGMWASYNGQSIKSLYRFGLDRDSAGRIIRGQFDEDGGSEYWEYDEYGRIHSYGIAEFDSGETDIFHYGPNGMVSYAECIMGGMDEYWNDDYYLIYSNYVLDEYKNWISRTVMGSDNEIYTETRKITYYENNMEFYEEKNEVH